MKKTLLLVFIHGFKGGEHTFHNFPQDLRALLQHSLSSVEVLTVVYPAYETRGDLRECVARFTEWLQNKVIDLEVANETPSPTVDPSVHVVLCGHSMGGIVAADTLLKVARDQPIPQAHCDANVTRNATETEPSSAAPSRDAEPSRIYFPYIRAVIAFDTPYLGISPGVLAHGAEEHFNQASSAYKAYGAASEFFGWGAGKSGSAEPIANASSKALPASGGAAANSSAGWSKWGKYAAVGSAAAAAVAGAAGAAYLGRNQISQGIAWAGSHLEFIGCLARGAELQKRVEGVVELSRTHGVGFADYYTALGEKATNQNVYSASALGADRTFCVIPKQSRNAVSAANRSSRSPSASDGKKDEGEQVQEYADDSTKSKGRWVKCVNLAATDEVNAHTSMFTPQKNPDYHSMVPRARDQIMEWLVPGWDEAPVEAGEAETLE